MSCSACGGNKSVMVPKRPAPKPKKGYGTTDKQNATQTKLLQKLRYRGR